MALLVAAEPPAVCRLSLHRDQPPKNLIKTTNCAQKKKNRCGFCDNFFGVKLHGHSGVTKKFPILNEFSRGWLRGTTVVSSGSPTTPPKH